MYHSTPPAPDCGHMSSRTAALRPGLDLTEEQVTEARRMRRDGDHPREIAFRMGLAVEDVERALLAMRTPKADRSRASLNVTMAAREFVSNERRVGEAVHQTVDRLLRELVTLRSGL